MFVLVVTGKKELADDKAVLLGNAHHGLRLLKLEAGCVLLSARLWKSAFACFSSLTHMFFRFFLINNIHMYKSKPGADDSAGYL